ncbi:MAG: GldM family protein [Bacteroidota bacterium]
MSIPKEPRQLMINIMYLVLTALLALNVSAEIFNAFEMVDEGLNAANTSLDASNKAMPELIKEQSKKKASLATYADRIDGIRTLSQESTDYIDEIVNVLIDESGVIDGKVDDNDYVVVKGGKRELRGKKNYDGTTRIMVDGGKGLELRDKMLEIKQKFIEFADEEDRASLTAKIPIEIDDEAWRNSPNEKKDWADFTFGHMPLGATMPIFSKFKNDIKASEAELLNYLAGKVGVGGATVVLDKYTVVSAPKKTYIIKGEQFETDVFLSASAGTDSQTGLSISVNGRSLRPDKDGVAKFTQGTSSTGLKKYNAAITIKDPVTEETQTFRKEFEYEVGERSVAISASKMNVFYIGVDNPVEISAAGVNSTNVKVSMDGGSIKRNSDGTYTVTATTPSNNAKVNVSADGLNASKVFRVKRIPDPVPKLSKKRGGVMSPGEFKAQPGVLPVLENFDFDTKCTINGFRLVRVAPRSDAEISANRGGKYGNDSRSLINKAKPGDRFFYEEIKCTCPGDKAPRNLGGMNFMIR